MGLSAFQLNDLLSSSDMGRLRYDASRNSSVGCTSHYLHNNERSRTANRSQVCAVPSHSITTTDSILRTLSCLQGLLAQYGLSQTEVERWMRANGSMSSFERGDPTAARQSSMRSVAPVPSHSSSTGWQMAPVVVGSSASGQGQMDMLPPDQAVLLSWRQARAAAIQPAPIVKPTSEILKEFEAQVQWVAQQANHLRNT